MKMCPSLWDYATVLCSLHSLRHFCFIFSLRSVNKIKMSFIDFLFFYFFFAFVCSFSFSINIWFLCESKNYFLNSYFSIFLNFTCYTGEILWRIFWMFGSWSLNFSLPPTFLKIKINLFLANLPGILFFFGSSFSSIVFKLSRR